MARIDWIETAKLGRMRDKILILFIDTSIANQYKRYNENSTHILACRACDGSERSIRDVSERGSLWMTNTRSRHWKSYFRT